MRFISFSLDILQGSAQPYHLHSLAAKEREHLSSSSYFSSRRCPSIPFDGEELWFSVKRITPKAPSGLCKSFLKKRSGEGEEVGPPSILPPSLLLVIKKFWKKRHQNEEMACRDRNPGHPPHRRVFCPYFYAVKFIQPRLQKAMGPGFTLEEIRLKTTYLSARGVQYEDPRSKERLFRLRKYGSILLSLSLEKIFTHKELTVNRPYFFFYRPEKGTWSVPGDAEKRG